MPNTVMTVRSNSCHLLQSTARPGLSVWRREVDIACKITSRRCQRLFLSVGEKRSQHLQNRRFMLIASLLTLHGIVLTATSPLATFILSSLYSRWPFCGMIHPTRISRKRSPAASADFLLLTAR